MTAAPKPFVASLPPAATAANAATTDDPMASWGITTPSPPLPGDTPWGTNPDQNRAPAPGLTTMPDSVQLQVQFSPEAGSRKQVFPVPKNMRLRDVKLMLGGVLLASNPQMRDFALHLGEGGAPVGDMDQSLEALGITDTTLLVVHPVMAPPGPGAAQGLSAE